MAAQLTQRIDKIANRALVHARHPGQLELAAQQRQRCRERAHGRAGIAHEKLSGRLGRSVTQTRNAHGAACFFDRATDLTQRIKHHARVVGGQQVVHGGGATA